MSENSSLYHTILSVLRSIMGSENEKLYTPQYVFRQFVIEKIEAKNSSVIPKPRSGHRIVCDSSNLYSFGGYNPHFQTDNPEDHGWVEMYPLFQELWRFNFATQKWFRYPIRDSLPKELASNAVILNGNTLMVYGGTGSPFGYRCSNKLFMTRLCYDQDVAENMIQINTSGKEPIPQYGQALVFHQGCLYTIGGTTGFAYTCDIHKLDLRTKIWEDLYICQGDGDYEPVGRYRHEVAFDGTNIYVLGGGTAEEAYSLSTIPVFDIEKKKWRKVKTRKDLNEGYPPPRRCHGAVQITTDNDIHVFVVGGYNGNVIFSDIWKLELSTLQWTLISNTFLQIPLYFHSTAITPAGKLYIFGGIYEEFERAERTNTIYSAWMCIPKLSEMCWEALLHYHPNLMHIPQEKLVNIGLPRNYINRLAK